MPRVAADGSGGGRPDWRPRAVRCGLELALIVLSTTYLTLEIQSPFLAGFVLALGLVSAVAVLFWCLDRHVYAWVRYASNQARRRQRSRRRRTLSDDDSE